MAERGACRLSWSSGAINLNACVRVNHPQRVRGFRIVCFCGLPAKSILRAQKDIYIGQGRKIPGKKSNKSDETLATDYQAFQTCQFSAASLSARSSLTSKIVGTFCRRSFATVSGQLRYRLQITQFLKMVYTKRTILFMSMLTKVRNMVYESYSVSNSVLFVWYRSK